MKLKVAQVSNPPVLTPADLVRIQIESDRLYAAFTRRTIAMEVLTSVDLRTRVRSR